MASSMRAVELEHSYNTSQLDPDDIFDDPDRLVIDFMYEASEDNIDGNCSSDVSVIDIKPLASSDDENGRN